jgi:hypothetical protein
MKPKEEYRPLPRYLTIKPSQIDGLGLYTTQQLFRGQILGITHIENKDFPDGYIRTPLGGFINHVNKPNCKLYKQEDYYMLEVVKDIDQGEEITLKYQHFNTMKK